MEDNNNTVNLDALFGELQTLNQGVASENEKIDELVQYLIVKDKQEQEQKEQEQAEKEVKADAEELTKSEAETREAETTEIYTELLTDIKDQAVLTNQLLAVQGVFIGIVIGLLFMKTFIDRLFK